MKLNDEKKPAIEKFDRSKEPKGGDKQTLNPATSNNEPFDERQFEEEHKDLFENTKKQKPGNDIHEEKGDLGI